MSFVGLKFSKVVSYLTAEMQSAYSTAPADWASKNTNPLVRIEDDLWVRFLGVSQTSCWLSAKLTVVKDTVLFGLFI